MYWVAIRMIVKLPNRTYSVHRTWSGGQIDAAHNQARTGRRDGEPQKHHQRSRANDRSEWAERLQRNNTAKTAVRNKAAEPNRRRRSD